MSRFAPLLSTMLVGLLSMRASAQEDKASQPPDPSADLIVRNARITTLDDRREEATALAVRDGKFVAVGSDDDVAALRGASTRVIDAQGRRVIPGLNDSHVHATRGGRFYHLELRWDGVDSLARGLSMVREQAARTPAGQWVRVVGGWTPYQFSERRMPTTAELTAAAPRTPVFVLLLYSQGLLNRAGVRALGLTESSVVPAGGRIEFREDGGAILHAEPSPAILYGTIGRLPHLSAEEQLNSTRYFYRELNRFGLTSVIDPGGGGHVFPADYAATRTLADSTGVPIRISNYLFAQNAGAELEAFRSWTASEKIHVNLALQRLGAYATSGAGENLVWSAGDYENFLAARPALADRMERELTPVVRLLAEHGWPIRIHATYDESITRILDVFEPVFDAANYKARWCIDHAETISAKNLERIRSMGGGIAIQNRMAFAGEFFVERYGADAAKTAPPLRRILDAGIPCGAGTDGTRVSSYNPWLSLAWLVSGRTVGGMQLMHGEDRLTRTEALRLYTIGSAWFSGEERTKGRIAEGQLADFAILSADYFAVGEEEICAIESVLTVVGGEVVFAAEPFQSLSPAPLPDVAPDWSPSVRFPGYQQPAAAGGARR